MQGAGETVHLRHGARVTQVQRPRGGDAFALLVGGAPGHHADVRHRSNSAVVACGHVVGGEAAAAGEGQARVPPLTPLRLPVLLRGALGVLAVVAAGRECRTGCERREHKPEDEDMEAHGEGCDMHR